MLDELLKLLKEHGIDAPVSWNTEKPTREGSHWFRGTSAEVDGKTFYQARFGDWGRGQSWEWESQNIKEMSGETKTTFDKLVADRLAEEEKERRERQVLAAGECAKFFDSLSDVGSTPYMSRKGITDLFGCRIAGNEKGDPILVMPLRSCTGELFNLQRIYSEREGDRKKGLWKHGTKFMHEGARVSGLFHILTASDEQRDLEDVLGGAGTIYICEGFATAASTALALRRYYSTKDQSGHYIVVSALNSGNLGEVATDIRRVRPDARIVFCADNDAFTEFKNADGTKRKYNVGLEKAKKAAALCQGEIRFPSFPNPAKGLTDFNDLHMVTSLDEVARQILEPTAAQVESQTNMVEEAGARRTHMQIARDFLAGHSYLRQTDEDLLEYSTSEKHWKVCKKTDENKLRIKLSSTMGDKLPVKVLDQLYKMVLMIIPEVPPGMDPFQPGPHRANFKNGLLEIVRTQHTKYEFKFTSHGDNDANMDRYCMNTIPLDCPDLVSLAKPVSTPKFDAWLERAFRGCADQGELIQATLEAIGSAIIAPGARIFWWHGAPETGKSTIIQLIERLLNYKNIAAHPPHKWVGDFAFAPMLNKLVNAVSELSTYKPVALDALKSIFDEAPVTVNRKYKEAVLAGLPFIHLFASNGIPPMIDLTARALDRRITFINMQNPVAQDQHVERGFDEYLFQHEADGILLRGLQAVLEVMSRGVKFTAPASSIALIRSVEKKEDLVAQFLSDVETGEIDAQTHIKIGPNCRIERKLLWECFKLWQQASEARLEARLGKYTFMERIESRGFRVVKTHNSREFIGIGVAASENSVL